MGINNNAYRHPQLLETILTKFRELGLHQRKLTREDIAGMDEMHLQGPAVSKYLANKLNVTSESSVLDVGCGIGGPCRMFADEFDCSVVGVDDTPEYVQTARALTEMMGLADKASFRQADACQLPFQSASFDIVWTQHVQMNIANKEQYYSEIQRVLKPGGRFVYYGIFSAGQVDIDFPVPWAKEAAQSHLQAHREVDDYFDYSQYRRVYTENLTPSSVLFAKNSVEELNSGNAPALGVHLLFQEDTQEMLSNLLRALVRKKLEVHAGIYAKRVERLDTP